MCGIVGVFHYRRDGRVDPAVVARMRDTMVHRGPDGAGIWSSPDGRVVLGHRRLAIIDLSADASQPMCNEDGSIWVTFNGEIYNHLELRRELQAAGRKFKTDHSDTEAIIHGYAQWGLAGLAQRLAGDYGIGLWDQRRGQLHLMRDRVGVKPVYFALRNGLLAFASEIKALLEHPDIQADLEPVAMYHYLSFLTTPAPLTMFRGIYKMPPGCLLSLAINGEPSLVRYWSAMPSQGIAARELDGMNDRQREDFYVAGVRARLRKSVARRMMSDVPFGVFLSGGIDSSTNLALMTELMDRPVDTFTVGFSDHTHLNELEPARAMARRFSANHHEVLIDERSMVGYIDQLIHSQDEPIADWTCIPLYFVSRLARESGATVVQVGEGSDEQFCGYSSYLKYLRLHRQFWQPYRRFLPGPVRELIASGARMVAERNLGFAVQADFIDRATRNREIFWSGAHVFRDLAKQRLTRGGRFEATPELDGAVAAGLVDPGYATPDTFNVVRSFLDPLDRAYPDSDQLTRMIACEFQLRLPELLLMRVDKICMSTTIEARVPFLDHELIEFTMDIPERSKIRGNVAKHLLKKSVEGWIPRETIRRGKMGFDAPMSLWLRGEFGGRVESQLASSRLMNAGYFDQSFVKRICREHRDAVRDHSLCMWTLFNLAAWYDYWIEGRMH